MGPSQGPPKWAQKQAFDSVSYVYMGSIGGGMLAAGRLPDGILLIGGTDNFQAGDYKIYIANERKKAQGKPPLVMNK